MASLIPGSTDAEKAAIDVPVFLGFGDHDLTADYVGSLSRYRSATDATLFVLSDSAHCHNQAVTRTVLWDRIVGWITCIDLTPANRPGRLEVDNGGEVPDARDGNVTANV
jgi:hypothetical protein